MGFKTSSFPSCGQAKTKASRDTRDTRAVPRRKRAWLSLRTRPRSTESLVASPALLFSNTTLDCIHDSTAQYTAHTTAPVTAGHLSLTQSPQRDAINANPEASRNLSDCVPNHAPINTMPLKSNPFRHDFTGFTGVRGAGFGQNTSTPWGRPLGSQRLGSCLLATDRGCVRSSGIEPSST